MRPWIILTLLFPYLLSAQAVEACWRHRERTSILTECAALPPNEAKKCSDATVLRLLAAYLKYPNTGSEGVAVVSYKIDERGMAATPFLARDIPGGAGEAALTAIEAIRTDGHLRYRPGAILLKDGWEPVQIQMNLPVRFHLGARASLLKKADQWYPHDREKIKLATAPGVNKVLPQLRNAPPKTGTSAWVRAASAAFHENFGEAIRLHPALPWWYGKLVVQLRVNDDGLVRDFTLLGEFPPALRAPISECLEQLLRIQPGQDSATPQIVLLQLPIWVHSADGSAGTR